jgi:flagella basal body P-ring formation protein FlgA
VTTYQPFRNARPIALANMQEVVPATEVVLALLHGVRRGEIIRQSNVTRIRLPVSGQGSAASMGIVQPALMTEAVIGMEATRTIAANQPLDARSLKPRIVVKRNDMVTVTSFAPGVRVETRARALENGAVGDLVRLQSSNRQGTYTANVTGEKTATVYAGGVKVSSPPARQRQFNFSSQPQRRAAQ